MKIEKFIKIQKRYSQQKKYKNTKCFHHFFGCGVKMKFMFAREFLANFCESRSKSKNLSENCELIEAGAKTICAGIYIYGSQFIIAL